MTAKSELITIPEAAELKTMSAEDIVATFNKDEKEVYEYYRKEIHGQIEKTLMWHYTLGEYTAKVYDRLMQSQGTTARGGERKHVYNARLFERVTLALHVGEEPRLFRNVMRLVKAWPTRAEFRRCIVTPQGPDGTRLSWTHAMHLAGVEDKELRDELTRRALEERLTSGELFKVIQKLLPDRGDGTGGRQIAIPANASACLKNVLGMTDSMLLKYSEAWMGERFDLKTAFAEIPPDRIDDETVAKIKEVREKVTELGDWNNKMGRLLLELENEAERKRATQAEMANEDEEEADTISLAEHRRRQQKADQAGKKAKKKSAKSKKTPAPKRPAKKKAGRKRPGVKKP